LFAFWDEKEKKIKIWFKENDKWKTMISPESGLIINMEFEYLKIHKQTIRTTKYHTFNKE